MKLILLFLIGMSSFCLDGYAKRLNYIKSDLLRMSAYPSMEDWIGSSLNNSRKYSYAMFEFSAMIHPKTPDLIKNLKNNDKIKRKEEIQNSYGRPYDVAAKVSLGLKIKKFQQFFQANAGAVARVTNPVFSSQDLFFYQDFSGTTSYIHSFNKKMTIIPQITYGHRRILNSSFTVSQIIDKKADTKINNKEWKFFNEFSLAIKSSHSYGDLFLEGHSFPLRNYEYSYWQVRGGYKTINLASYLPLLDKFQAHISFSPLYEGDYKIERTLKYGIYLNYLQHCSLNLYLHDQFYLGLVAKIDFKYLEWSFFSSKKSYNDYGTQTSRQYGMGLLIKG